MTIGEALDYGTRVLRDNEVLEPRRESALLLTLASGKDRAYLIANPDKELETATLERFRGYTERRAAHEPFQYISGHQEFFGLDFIVTPDVLIPRPETEALVEAAIEIIRDKNGARFCEIGVGSGCIAISILRSVKSAEALAADISEKALAIAQENSVRHDVSHRLELQLSNIFESIEPQQFDLIVSNPPYVPLEDITTLQPEVRDFEPHSSLTDGNDGLSILRCLIQGSPKFLKTGGVLLLEIGFNQSAKVRRMLGDENWESVEMRPDLQGIPRIVRATVK